MSTGITREPKGCPSCGRENPPTAARCSACLTPIDGTIQTSAAPAADDARNSGPLRSQAPSAIRSGCAGALIWFWIGVLTIASAGVTFFLTCLGMVGATNAAAPAISGYSAETMTNIIFTVSGIAAVAVAALIIFAFRRRRRR